MKYKTFNEFLKFYKIDIDTFTTRHIADCSDSDYNLLVNQMVTDNTLSYIIDSAFIWSRTREGVSFWGDLDIAWSKYYASNHKEILTDVENFFQVYIIRDLSIVKDKLKASYNFNEALL